MASDIEQKMIPNFSNSSLNVVPTETLSKTASTATFFGLVSILFSAPITPARNSCSLRGIPSLAYVSNKAGSTSSSDLGFFANDFGLA